MGSKSRVIGGCKRGGARGAQVCGSVLGNLRTCAIYVTDNPTWVVPAMDSLDEERRRLMAALLTERDRGGGGGFDE
jgi:hypothetical protein